MQPLSPTSPIPLRVVATGHHLPIRRVTSAEVDVLTGMTAGWTQRHTGVETRHHVGQETAAEMGAIALRESLARGSWDQPQLLIAASGTPQQLIPCSAALMARELTWDGLPCFDVNATCLGFVVALQVAGALIAAGNHTQIAIACSEIASRGLNWKQPEAAGLMGDGAAAILLERDDTGSSQLIATLMETWPAGAGLTEIRGGGNQQPAMDHQAGVNTDDYLFHMDGPAVFRLASEKIEPFVTKLIGSDDSRWDDIDWVIPHQASLPAIRHLRRRLGIPQEKIIETVQHHGNVIAASMPLALHEMITSGRLQRGQKVLFLGTSAGFSLGGALLRY